MNPTQNTTSNTTSSTINWTRNLSQHTPLPISPALTLHNTAEHAFNSIASRLKLDLQGMAQLSNSIDKVKNSEARLFDALNELEK